MPRLPLLKYVLVFTLFDYLLLILCFGWWGDIDDFRVWILLAVFLVSLVALLISKNTLLTASTFKQKANSFIWASAGAYFIVVALGFTALHYGFLAWSDYLSSEQGYGAGLVLFFGYIMITVMATIYAVIILLNLIMLHLLEQSRLKGGSLVDKILLLLVVASGLSLL